MLTREFGNFKYMTPVMRVAVALGVCWAALSLLMMIAFPVTAIVALLSGPMVALYGTMLYCSRGVNLLSGLGTAVLVVTGVLHVPWMLAIAMCLSLILPSWMTSALESAAMVAVTGMVFSIVIPSITGSWRAFVAMLSGTVLATAADDFIPCVPIDDTIPGFGIAILHLSIVATLLFTTLAAIAARERPGVCKSCGYDLAGNIGGVCPECGVDALRPVPHPFDLEVTSERPRA